VSDTETELDQPQRPARRRTWRANVGLLCASAVAGLVLVEAVLRILGLYPGAAHLLRDADRGWRHRPGARFNGHRINRWGFEGPDFPLAKPPGERRVLCMGDSCTFGQSVGPQDTYPAALQRMLGAKVRVINGGVNGYSSYQGLQWFRRIAPRIAPDVVTVFYGWNDHWLSRIGGPDKTMAGSTLERVRCVLSRSRVFEFGVLGWHALRSTANIPFLEDKPAAPHQPPPAQPPAPAPKRELRVGLEDYAANLRAFVTWCKANGAQAILLTAPNYLDLADTAKLPDSAYQVTDKTSVAELRALHRSYNAAVRRVAREEGASLVDLCRIFADARDPAKCFAGPPRDFVHPSAYGFGLIARALADAITAEGAAGSGTRSAPRQ